MLKDLLEIESLDVYFYYLHLHKPNTVCSHLHLRNKTKRSNSSSTGKNPEKMNSLALYKAALPGFHVLLLVTNWGTFARNQ